MQSNPPETKPGITTLVRWALLALIAGAVTILGNAAFRISEISASGSYIVHPAIQAEILNTVIQEGLITFTCGSIPMVVFGVVGGAVGTRTEGKTGGNLGAVIAGLLVGGLCARWLLYVALSD